VVERPRRQSAGPMHAEFPSRTALGAALYRAAHQLVDKPPVFEDPLALRIVGEAMAEGLRGGRERHGLPQAAPLRAFIAMRSRYAEDSFAQDHDRGTRQYVLLGAGLDTFAYRQRHRGVTVFEVDHPATQAWKRRLLAESGIAIPESAVYAPVDFEHESLRDGLVRARFDFARRAFFAWLGVTPYLSADAIRRTLFFVAALPSQSEIVFEYAEPRNGDDDAPNRFFAAMSARVAAAGEPFRSFFAPQEMATMLRETGFGEIEDLDCAALNARYFAGRADGLCLRGSAHMIRART